MSVSLNLKDYTDRWIYLDQYDCFFLERVPYCSAQEVPAEQCMNLFVPAVYMDGSGSVKVEAEYRGYTAATVPVIFENGLAGYKEAEPFEIGDDRSAAKDFLAAGFVYVSCGCRGRSSVNAEGQRCGKAPLSLVDLKAGIRFLRANAGVIPGDMERIISVGISAGGAMSTLLGCTGNSENYREELGRIGAVMDQRDDVFAAQCYCPIIDLDHADFAYEWMFEGRTHYDGMPFVGFSEGELTPFARALSDRMGQLYMDYFNGMGLKHPATGEPLLLGTGRGGSAAAFLKEKLEESAAKYLGKLEQGGIPCLRRMDAETRADGIADYGVDKADAKDCDKQPVEPGNLVCSNAGRVSAADYISGRYLAPKFDFATKAAVYVPGIDKSAWLSWDGRRAAITSIDDMQKTYHTRLKLCPAFDDLDLIQAENQEFGTAHEDVVHFNPQLAGVMETLCTQFPDETEKYLSGYQKVAGDTELAQRRYLLNPMNYIGTEEQADLAPHYRIRVGSRDADTSLTITMTLALRLMETGRTDVDYEIVWDEPHGRADYPGEVTAWVDRICRKAE